MDDTPRRTGAEAAPHTACVAARARLIVAEAPALLGPAGAGGDVATIARLVQSEAGGARLRRALRGETLLLGGAALGVGALSLRPHWLGRIARAGPVALAPLLPGPLGRLSGKVGEVLERVGDQLAAGLRPLPKDSSACPGVVSSRRTCPNESTSVGVRWHWLQSKATWVDEAVT